MIDNISWAVAYPEVLLLIMACAIALVDLGVTTARRGATLALSLMTLLSLTGLLSVYALSDRVVTGFGGMVVMDPLGSWLKAFAALAVAVTLIYGRLYAFDRNMLKGGELYVLSLFALLGMFIMISGRNFLVIYLGLEMLTLASYALVALRRDDGRATEAAMKYFVLGALASGFLLYGMSMIYGATGSLDVAQVTQAMAAGHFHKQALVLGLVFLVAGLAFKLGVVPFHMWIPDIYHGAPTVVTLLVGGAPKLAAFAIVIRLLVEGALPLAADWQQMLSFLAVASLLVGNLAAIAQTNIKRMLAFSTISQMGFLLLSFVAGVQQGDSSNTLNAYSAGMFYVVSYVLTTLASFGVLMVLSRPGREVEHLSDLSGLNARRPGVAATMAVCMFSLAGIPPMVGFHAKLSVLQSLVAMGQPWMYKLAIFAVLMSLVGAFYYLRVVKVMYFDEPAPEVASTSPEVGEHAGCKGANALLGLNGLSLIGLGLIPAGLMGLCTNAMHWVVR